MAENVSSMQSYREWHELLEAICIQQGYLDNLSLAEKLCGAVGNQTQDAFETMQRNLHNWRNGTHVPQRRNFLLLGRILQVNADQVLSEKWNDLYKRTRKSGGAHSNPAPNPDMLPQIKRLRFMFLGSVVSSVVLALLVGYLLLTPEVKGPGYTNIVYHRNVNLDVGESQIIHGRRSACGSMPPRWEDIKDELPELKIGSWSDGGVGIRNSRSCGGPTPARALLFTATAVGHSSFNLYSDPITIEVK